LRPRNPRERGMIVDAFHTERAKVAAAQARYRLERVTEPDGALFARAYGMLHEFFGPRGELQNASILRGLVRPPDCRFGDGLHARYHLVVAWHGDELVAVRDCYTEVDPARRLCLIALSHSLVAPAHRRSGLAALLRTFPIELARDFGRVYFEDVAS